MLYLCNIIVTWKFNKEHIASTFTVCTCNYSYKNTQAITIATTDVTTEVVEKDDVLDIPIIQRLYVM